jgi:thioredoxin-like negative regulator of GroEL
MMAVKAEEPFRHKESAGGTMAEIKHTSDAAFQKDVMESGRPVIVDFWAPWCGPCKLVAPELEKLAAQYDGKVDIVKVNVQHHVNPNDRLLQGCRCPASWCRRLPDC